MIRTGIWLFPSAGAPDLVERIRRADDAGIDEFWLGDEGLAREPFSVLAAAAVRTDRIRLGIAVTNPYVRPPALTAATARTIAELAGPQRLLVGIGAGGSMALEPFGLAATRPLRSVTAALEVISEVGGGTFPIYIGARSAGLNRLASRRADGAFVAGLPPARYGEVLGWCRSVRPIEIALYPSVAFSAEEVERSRPHMLWTLANAPAETAGGFGVDSEAVTEAANALSQGDEGPARALMTDEALDQVLLRGEPDRVGARLAELVRTHRPSSIGMAQLEPRVEEAAAAFAAMRSALAADAPVATR